MASRKSGKNKRRVPGRKKKNILFPFIVTSVVLLTVVAAFFVLVIKPDDRLVESVLQPQESKVPFTYEEPGTPHTVVVESEGKKHLPENETVILEDADWVETEKPLLAIVIDDMGYKLKTGMNLLDLNLDLSFAFLPAGPNLDALVKKATMKGRDILLHMPLEPADQRWDPGPGALFISMNETMMRSTFKKNLAALPSAAGVNNHMGSRFTQNRRAMKIFLEIVGENDLYFLDSMTSRNSLGYFMAREMGVKTAKRHVFLDNDKDVRKIRKQLRHLLDLAEKNGWAIGIGHPNPETFAALREMRSEIGRRVNLVGVSRLVR